MLRTSFLYLLASLLILLAACEKETSGIQPEQNNAENIFDIEAFVENGMLSFPTKEAFIKAIEMVAQTSDEEMLIWTGSIGFHSLWEEFLTIEDRISEDMLPQDLLSDREKERYQLEDDVLTPRFSIRPIGYLVNTDFRLIVGGQLHYFDDEKHIVVADGDVLKLEKALSGKESSQMEKVAVTIQGGNQPQQKLESKLYSCGGGGYVTSVAHQKTVNNDRLRVEIRTYTWYEQSGSQWEGHMQAYLNIRNLEKSGLIWKHTGRPTIVNATSGSVSWTMNLVYPNPTTLVYYYSGVTNSSPETIAWYDEILIEADGRFAASQYTNQYSQFLSGQGRGPRTDISSLDIEVGCY